ncbi:methyltransferase domain-containing protein [Actinospica durhamensis]|uniref:Methyltransferase domain-containing protein n=1 Tax=Actinospica durhamensis TaxID=1508375 RepID=A0A941EQD3_9ACTN|nr:class I SAM-dependent methyltransferase [Actinospica durhamensis]MBR7836555.1 methyltransferase domain-containing protein [Actinospica durhamensis]
MTGGEYLEAVRASYDEVAADYLELVESRFPLDLLGRALLAAFAEHVRADALGPVADLGCGPGLVTAHLAALGVDVFGLDLSPRMVDAARRRFPDLDFAVGSMTALDVPDGSLGAILAWFSTHHMPPEMLAGVFAEFARTLAPGGRLLLGTHLGTGEHTRPTRAYGGHPVSYESFLLPAEQIVGLLEDAGFDLERRTLEQPTPREHTRILVRRR